ncbi:hypothetical protein TcCL_ESM04005 [Trypanosoma cruzi]|uniref:Uncharacterized protein n=2 Tax=Trypanosoma cruzi TaxID=5693 RepID=Q4DPE1_TRYCC|nr:hypothetical protein, conserved [Trypanosoma cruzi]EAN94394.1 hypothetical protein, conserved [Trypanosoma cruzi]KAF5219444.1 hypothetical protein ECC02_007587 [Trypanosoma cruzi]RNC58360.1 hypothetical protein TcCL_ESM04005 [Trypanosoma cruzi]|eukprot:XP_816245.1 hypothetical protein [Trypanosoma cruzi strain CL Brener]
MEIQLGEKVALLTTHKTYRDDLEDGVRAVARYLPFCKYVATCAEHGPVPSTFIIRSIRRVAQRIVGLIMDVECVTRSGKIVQTVDICDSNPVIIFPVATVNGIRYAILVRKRQVSVGCNFIVEALCGVENNDGSFTIPNDELLIPLGVDLQKTHALSSKRYTIGNEGTTPYKVYSVTLEMTPETLQKLQNTSKDLENALIALPLDEVLSTVGDVKASLAASLLLVS